jgi:gliding motility-associated lipoprotein GldH
MRIAILLLVCAIISTACDENRLYEKNTDFKNRYWLAGEQPAFEFEIADVDKPYNLYFMVRNESNYPYANLYFTYYLTTEEGRELQRHLVSELLFDKKTGRPLGSSGLGDIYSHQFLLLKDFSFPNPGTYKIRYEQFMRTDTLRGMLSVGLRVEQTQGQ